IEAVHKCKASPHLLVGHNRASTEGTSIRYRIEFVEEHAAVPERLTLIVDVRSLPRINFVAPHSRLEQTVAGYAPGICSGGSVEIGVTAIPLTSRAERDDGQVPRTDHGHDAFHTGL